MNNIVYRGTLTKEKLKELSEQHLKLALDTKYNPNLNKDAISLIKQPDGNWIGEMFKNGVIVSSREVGPDTALQVLITHP